MSLIVLIYTFTGILFNYKHSLKSALLSADSYACALHESGIDQSLKRLLGALKPRKLLYLCLWVAAKQKYSVNP